MRERPRPPVRRIPSQTASQPAPIGRSPVVSRTHQPVQHLAPQQYPPVAGDVILDVEEDYTPRTPTSIVRYDRPGVPIQYHPQPVKRRRPPETDQTPAVAPPRRIHWLVYVGVGMMIAFILWIAANYALVGLSTWNDDRVYGRPRTFQIDKVVGHHDSSANPTHFIAMNLNSTIVVEEIPGGDISKSKYYQCPQIYGDGADLVPIILTFEDVNHDGNLDMIVHFQANVIIYLNEKVYGQWVFVPQKKGATA